MFKRLMLATMTVVFSAAMTVWAADDDVFIDEGDGDFDAMPLAPTAEEKPVEPEKKAEDLLPEPAPVQATSPGAGDLFEQQEMTPPPQPEKPAKKPKAAKLPSKPAAQKTAKASKGVGAKGKFVMTNASCPLMREPASTSEPIAHTAPSRKIWVEQVDTEWVRGWNKAGEPGYISSDCVN